jgi:hypothetical protein
LKQAKKGGANTERADKNLPEPTSPIPANHHSNTGADASLRARPESLLLENVITRLRIRLEPAMHAAARQAAAREHERTREWLENRGLPKAARVAQHEAYNVLKKYGLVNEALRTRSEIGRTSYALTIPHALSDNEVDDLAQACVAVFETQGRSIEATLSGMSAEAGGFLPPDDAARVREKACALLSGGDGRGGE